jgi:DUF2938 family protein
MSQTSEFILRAFFIGTGATMMMDFWALFLKQLGIPSLSFAFLGRWIGHLADGQWTHESIAKAAPIRGELWMGWFAHYSIGVTFAAFLLAVYGLEWARKPTLVPALIVGFVTVVAPLFILQPALGAGIASSKTPKPVFNSVKSLITHTVFGIGLYLAALATATLIPAAPVATKSKSRCDCLYSSVFTRNGQNLVDRHARQSCLRFELSAPGNRRSLCV